MSEENKLNEEVNEEVVPAAEETAENVEEIIEDAVEETVENAEETAEEIVETEVEAEDIAGEPEAEIVLDTTVPAKKNLTPIIAIAAAAVVVIAVVVLYALGYFGIWFNKYNREYIDTTGRTIEEVAEQAGMTLDEFLDEFELPKKMPKNTYESAAFYTMPVSKVAEVYGISFDTLKEQLELPEETTEKDEWGKVEGEMTLRQYVGEENLEDFKAAYGFGDEVTADTKWKEIRTVVDTKQKESREASEKSAAEVETGAEDSEDE